LEKQPGEDEEQKKSVLVTVGIEAVNTSDCQIALNGLLEFSVAVDWVTAEATLAAGTMLTGTLAAGKRVQGSISFECDEFWNVIVIMYAPIGQEHVAEFNLFPQDLEYFHPSAEVSIGAEDSSKYLKMGEGGNIEYLRVMAQRGIYDGKNSAFCVEFSLENRTEAQIMIDISWMAEIYVNDVRKAAVLIDDPFETEHTEGTLEAFESGHQFLAVGCLVDDIIEIHWTDSLLSEGKIMFRFTAGEAQ